MYLVSRCGQLDNYNLSYWLQLLSAVTLTCSLLRENQPTPGLPFGIPQVVTLEQLYMNYVLRLSQIQGDDKDEVSS